MSMMQDKQVLSSLARLYINPDFQRFMDVYIQGRLLDAMQLCVEADNPARHQGAAQMLQSIQQDLEDAEGAYLRLTKQSEIPLD